MVCIADKETARNLDSGSLRRFMAGSCVICAALAAEVLNERSLAEIPRGKGQWVNASPKVRSSHDLGFLIRDKSGELTQIAVKDIDSAMLHDILDRADEIVISRVDVK